MDGVGTISPVNSTTPGAGEHNFLKPTWYPRTANSITPDLLVWGSVSTRNFADDSLSTNYSPSSNVSAKVITEPTDSRARRIVVENQGFDWEPNSTMAVLHYPKAPRHTGHLMCMKVFLMMPANRDFNLSEWNRPISGPTDIGN